MIFFPILFIYNYWAVFCSVADSWNSPFEAKQLTEALSYSKKWRIYLSHYCHQVLLRCREDRHIESDYAVWTETLVCVCVFCLFRGSPSVRWRVLFMHRTHPALPTLLCPTRRWKYASQMSVLGNARDKVHPYTCDHLKPVNNVEIEWETWDLQTQ